jgi:hypothetical protein
MLHLALLRQMDIDPHGMRLISFLGAALAMALLVFAGELLLASGAGVTAAGFALFFLGIAGEAHVQWNPSLILLPATLLLLSAGLSMATGKLWLHASAWAMLSVTVQLHPVALLAAPFLAASLWLAPGNHGRKLAALAVGCGLFLGSLLLTSWGAVIEALQSGIGPREASGGSEFTWLGTQWAEVVVLAGWALGFSVLTWRLGRPGGGAPTARVSPGAPLAPPTRRAAHGPRVLPILLGAGPVLLYCLLHVWSGHWLAPRYVLPFLPGLALLGGGVVAALVERGVQSRESRRSKPGSARLPTKVAVGIFCGLALFTADRYGSADPDFEPRFTFNDVKTVAATLPKLGIDNYGQAVSRLRGPGLFYLLSALQVHWDPLEAGQVQPDATDPGSAVLVVKTRRLPSAPPADWEAIRSGTGWLVFVPYAPSLLWDGAEVRCEKTGETGDGVTTEPFSVVRTSLDLVINEPGFPHYVGMPTWWGCERLRFRLPARLTTDEPLILIPVNPSFWAPATATVTAVEGLAYSGETGGNRLLVHGGQRGKRGFVELLYAFERSNPFLCMVPPLVFEVPTRDLNLWELAEEVN